MRHLEGLARLISSSATLQSECGALNQTDMYDNYIHEYEGLTRHHPPPCAIIFPGQWEWRKQGLERDERWNPEFTIELLRNPPADNATALTTQSREVMGVFQDIIDEIMQQEGQGVDFMDATQTYVGIQNLSLADGPYKGDIAEAHTDLKESTTQKVVWGATFSVEGF